MTDQRKRYLLDRANDILEHVDRFSREDPATAHALCCALGKRAEEVQPADLANRALDRAYDDLNDRLEHM